MMMADSELLFARQDINAAKTLFDADCNKVTPVPIGFLGISHIGIRIKETDLDRFRSFYNDSLQIEKIGKCTCRWDPVSAGAGFRGPANH